MPGALPTTGGGLSTITAGSTPTTIGIASLSAAKGTSGNRPSTQGFTPQTKDQVIGMSRTSSIAVAPEEMAQMQQKLSTMKNILATVPPSPKDTSSGVSRFFPGGKGIEAQQQTWETGVKFQDMAKRELDRAEQALKSGDSEGYKSHLQRAQSLAGSAAGSFSAAAGQNLQMLDKQRKDFNTALDVADKGCGAAAAYTGMHIVGNACSLTRIAVGGVDAYTDRGRDAASQQVFEDLVKFGAGQAIGDRLPEIGGGSIGRVVKHALAERGGYVAQKTLFGIETGQRP